MTRFSATGSIAVHGSYLVNSNMIAPFEFGKDKDRACLYINFSKFALGSIESQRYLRFAVNDRLRSIFETLRFFSTREALTVKSHSLISLFVKYS